MMMTVIWAELTKNDQIVISSTKIIRQRETNHRDFSEFYLYAKENGYVDSSAGNEIKSLKSL